MEVNRWPSKATVQAAAMDGVDCGICFQGYVWNWRITHKPDIDRETMIKKYSQDYNHVVSLSSNQGGCPR